MSLAKNKNKNDRNMEKNDMAMYPSFENTFLWAPHSEQAIHRQLQHAWPAQQTACPAQHNNILV